MAPRDATSPPDQHELLKHILSTVQSIQQNFLHLSAAVDSIQGQINVLARGKQVHGNAGTNPLSQPRISPTQPSSTEDQQVASDVEPGPSAQVSSLDFGSAGPSEVRSAGERKHSAAATSRIILTTYPGQSGIDPLTMNWGHLDALERGPVVVSRSQSTIRRRNGKGGLSLFSTVSLTFV